MAHPIPVVTLRDGTIHIELPSLKSIIEKAGDRPMAIYSINGATRAGKSFLLSFFVKYLQTKTASASPMSNISDWMNADIKNNFVWKSGRKPQTLGIEMWSEPFFLNNPDGTEFAVFLMDTQGNFDAKATNNQSSIIYVISCLLSSVLIFNVKEDIKEDTLQFFEFYDSFAQLTAGLHKNFRDSLHHALM